MSKKANRTGRSDKAARHVRIHHWVMDTAAWRDLTPVARALYLEIARCYAGTGSNNGRIGFSLRRACELLGVGKSTAGDAFRDLIGHGFLVITTPGGFSRKNRQATEYRLTEFPCDLTGGIASKEFIRWGPAPPREEQSTVPNTGHTVPQAGQHGFQYRTVELRNARYGT